ncbi:MAG: 4-hydroxybenzoate octaprenyltransferase [Phycisphaerales bacterium]|nr:4-hydroxybenzoate octaprenyltransferase [Planctomycetota bacterium]
MLTRAEQVIPHDQGTPARLGLVARDIKLSHSIFALPFAILGAFLAQPADMPRGRFAAILALVVVCMISARTYAMVVNRLADRRIDSDNPRTRGRVFASGSVTPAFGFAVLAGCVAAFLAATSLFWVFFGNAWPLLLAVPVLCWIGAYSFTKRFTFACHLFLGSSLAASPVAAAIAVCPGVVGLPSNFPPTQLAPGAGGAIWALAGMVMLWVAGFDIIYSLQDVAEDRRQRLFSVPSKLGVPAALWISRAFHAGAFVLLAVCWRQDPRLGALFGLGVALVGVLLVGEHAILARRGKEGLQAAFFTFNGIVSLVVGTLGVIDLVAV